MKTDIVIVGCGVSGLYCALKLPTDKQITVITKSSAEESDSFLAQGGICVERDENDYDSFFEDTLRAGHYENRRESVDLMIRSSRAVINELIVLGVRFQQKDGELLYTKEGAHSRPRILYHEDVTGQEITSCLLATARKRQNITLLEHTSMVDWLVEGRECHGIVVQTSDGAYTPIYADYTVMATGGVGGLYPHSTNYPHLTGDALALALRYGVALEHIDYVQIHPTTLYQAERGRSFLISESVRGEGAILLNDRGERFVDELLPRDVVANAIFEEMKKTGAEHVWLSMSPIPKDEILSHFPNIYHRCMEAGYDPTKEPIPVVPAQHYFMGGIWVDRNSKTDMARLYAVGETACNGVHGKNRLASNSLLESLVFAARAAKDMAESYLPLPTRIAPYAERDYAHCEEQYQRAVRTAIEKEKQSHE